MFPARMAPLAERFRNRGRSTPHKPAELHPLNWDEERSLQTGLTPVPGAADAPAIVPGLDGRRRLIETMVHRSGSSSGTSCRRRPAEERLVPSALQAAGYSTSP